MEPRQAAIEEVVGKLALPTAEKAPQMAEAPQLRPPDPRNTKSFIRNNDAGIGLREK